MSDKKRKLLKQTSLDIFMCGTIQSKSKRLKTDMNEEEKKTVKRATEKRWNTNKKCNDNTTDTNSASSTSEQNASELDVKNKNSKYKDKSSDYNMADEEDDFIPNFKPSKTNQQSKSFRGVPIASLNSAPSCLKNKEIIKPDKSHTVLFKCPYVYDGKKIPTPHPSSYKDKWDNYHVRMPCSHYNEYPVEGDKGTELRRRWELIEEAYKDTIIPGPFELEEAILSYNQRYKTRWDFSAFRKFFLDFLSTKEKEHFFEHTLPKIIKLALLLPSLCTQPIPLLKQYENHSISFSQQQIACLLANAFLCTFPRRNSRQKGSEYSNYPDINLNGLFQGGGKTRKYQKLKCIIHYFERVTTKMPCGVVTFTRQYIENTPNWDDVKLSVPEKIHVSSQGTIEDDGFGLLQVDFANKFIGGGVLGQGCVQEEIRFLICPEMLVTRLFTEVLDDKESLIMKGCERFSQYDGYADSFVWAGNYKDVGERDANGRLYTDVVAIDALVIYNPTDQFKSKMVKRELTKAYVGFADVNDNCKNPSRPAVCTGNWGCGAFRGDKQLKALIQLMAASVAKRDVCYFTFGDDKFTEDIYNIHKFLIESETEIGVLMLTIEGYYQNYCQSSRKRRKKIGLYQYIFESFEGNNHSESEEEWEEVQAEDDNNSHDIHDSSRENSIGEGIDLTEDQMEEFYQTGDATPNNIKLTSKDEEFEEDFDTIDSSSANPKKMHTCGSPSEKSLSDSTTSDKKSLSDSTTSDKKSLSDSTTSDKKSLSDSTTSDKKSLSDSTTSDKKSLSDRTTSDKKSVTDSCTSDKKSLIDSATTPKKSRTPTKFDTDE